MSPGRQTGIERVRRARPRGTMLIKQPCLSLAGLEPSLGGNGSR